MDHPMGLLIAFCLIQMSIVCHELGHVLAYRARGIEIERVVIGIPIRWVPRIRLSFRGTPVVVSMLLAGGLVWLTPEGRRQKELLSYHEQALINGAGILANFFFAGILFTIPLIIYVLCVPLPNVSPKLVFLMFATPGAMIVLWLARRSFCSYFIPIIGGLELITFLYLATTRLVFAAVGPVGYGKMVVEGAKTDFGGVAWAVTISLLLGVSNMFPFVPSDGGHTVLALFRNRGSVWEGRMKRIGLRFSIFLFLLACLRDAQAILWAHIHSH